MSELILNVDDDNAARYVKSRILRLAGYQVIEAANGAAAMQLLAERMPALVLLDVRLPDLNGRELASRIKKTPATAQIVVLQTSASHVDTKHRVASLDAGADGYISAPIEPEELVAHVRALLRMRKAEHERQKALDALREADRRKDEFLAMLAHELRNPLAPIRNAVALLRMPGTQHMTGDLAQMDDDVPARVVVLGGGVIGVEFASVFKSFGSEVTIVEALPRLVAAEDEAISTQLQRAFRKRGIAFRTGVRFAGARQEGDVVTLELDGGSTIEADLLLVAVGRGPSTDGLGYEEAGVTVERGLVSTDERLRTNVPNVYAVGDIVPGLQLAHRGFAQGIFVAEEIAGLSPAPVEDRGIPRVTYCDPEIASVGLTETQAREAYGEIETYEYNLGGNGKSQILQTQGFVKLVREKDGPVVGVHMIGARMGEQVGEAQLIVNWDAFPADVAGLVHAHPTQNEALGEAHLALAGKPLHAHA